MGKNIGYDSKGRELEVTEWQASGVGAHYLAIKAVYMDDSAPVSDVEMRRLQDHLDKHGELPSGPQVDMSWLEEEYSYRRRA